MKMKERKFEEVDVENEGVNSENEGVDNEVIPPEKRGYLLQNPSTINYNDGIYNRNSMGRNNMIVGSHDLHNFAKAYVNIVNAITTFVDPTPPTNIITNETILTQYSIKQGLKVFGKKCEDAVQK